MNIKSSVLFLLIAIWFSACSSITVIPPAPKGTIAEPAASDKESTPAAANNNVNNLLSCENGLSYIPVPAFQVWDFTSIELSPTGKPMIKTEKFPGKTEEINNLLPNLSMDVFVQELDADENIGFFQAKQYHRKIIMDFAKSRTEPLVNQQDEFYGYGRVGAGLRLEMEIWTTDSHFDGSLIGLAAGAKAKSTRGHLSAKIVGIDNPEVTLSMPFTADFSEGSIQKVIEAMAVIKSRLHDKEKTTLAPHVLARIECEKTKKKKPPSNNDVYK